MFEGLGCASKGACHTICTGYDYRTNTCSNVDIYTVKTTLNYMIGDHVNKLCREDITAVVRTAVEMFNTYLTDHEWKKVLTKTHTHVCTKKYIFASLTFVLFICIWLIFLFYFFF